jgi:hypothetical protein
MVRVARMGESATAGRRSEMSRYERKGGYRLEEQDPTVVEGFGKSCSRAQKDEAMEPDRLVGCAYPIGVARILVPRMAALFTCNNRNEYNANEYLRIGRAIVCPMGVPCWSPQSRDDST